MIRIYINNVKKIPSGSYRVYKGDYSLLRDAEGNYAGICGFQEVQKHFMD